jgi:curved DNA-binding protein
MEFKDYYKILGVEPKSELKEIKLAYRRLARKYHPDVSKQEDAEKKFQEIAEAYEVLKNPSKRAEYDELREYGGSRQNFEPPKGWRSATAHSFDDMGEGHSDFFRSVFGGDPAESGFSQARGGQFGMRGQDVDMELPVFLEDTLKPTSKTISYALQQIDEQGRVQQKPKTLEVKIPAGVVEGERIRLKGQGGKGLGDGGPGDLYLLIRLVPHPLFDVEGHNLILTLPLAPWEAALGTQVEAPTLDSKISLKIPANSQTGQRMRIKGRGLVRKTGGRGDLYAVLKVVMPKAGDEATKELWSKLSSVADFNPRAEWSD